MTQHDQNIANAIFPSIRSDINDALGALFSLSSGTSAPSTTVAGMLWYDTTNGLIKQRNAGDTAWVTLFAIGRQGLVDQSGATIYAADSVGTDSYAITISPAITAYATGQVFRVKIGTANTGAATLNVNGLGAVAIKKNYNSDLATGDLLANQMIEVVYDGASFQLLSPVVISSQGFPKGYINGKAPVFTDASTVTFPSGLRARDSGNNADIELTASVAVTLAGTWSVGTPGLDTGSEASNTWYYYYLIRRPDTGVCSVLASTVNENVTGSITLPTNYTQKRQLPFSVRNDSASDILDFMVIDGWPHRPRIIYNTSFALAGSTADTTFVATGQNAWTTVSLSSFVPALSRLAIIHHSSDGSGGSFNQALIRPTGSVAGEQKSIGGPDRASCQGDFITNASQQIDHQKGYAATAYHLSVAGYVITEI